MHFKNSGDQNEGKFWKIYFMTLSCFLAVGILPSLYLIKKYGLSNLLTKEEILSLIGLGAISSLFGIETETSFRIETKTSDVKAQAEMVRIAKGLPWLICKDYGSESEAEIHISVEGEMTIKSTCPREDIVSYYKEKLKENGFSYRVVEKDSLVLIKAKNEEVECNIEISDNDVTIVLSKPKS
ncbi:hypothetical protein [Chloracidobacterium thermophilum]|uniref:hypothetical protein n=1 Tax=Chloracidobacterium thermophilum TaxID=458033 RepID=UPI0007399CF9|nr:hypothetical protein [Chloracidobacterium thermophilum]